MKSYLPTFFLIALSVTHAFGQENTSSSLLQSVLAFASTELPESAYHRLRAERDYYRQDPGLSFFASYRRRTGDGFREEDLTLASGKTSYRAGIEWNLLENGWRENRSKASQKDIDMLIADQEQPLQAKSAAYFKQFLFADYLFDLELATIYQQRATKLTNRQPLFSSLFEERHIGAEPLLELDRRRAEAEQRLTYHKKAIEEFEQLFAGEEIHSISKSAASFRPPSIRISDLLAQYDSLSGFNLRNRLEQLRIENETRWWSGIQLTASLDYTRQVSFAGDQKDYTSVGLRLRMPLAKVWNSEKKLAYYQQHERFEKLYYEQQNRKKEIMTLYQEYAYKLKQLQNMEHEMGILNERSRVQHLLLERIPAALSEGDEPVLFIDDEARAAAIEILALKQDAIKLLLKINLALGQATIIPFLEFDSQSNHPATALPVITGGGQSMPDVPEWAKHRGLISTSDFK